MDRLAGKVAFITGTAGGQGRAAAEIFAAEGALVFACDVKADEAGATARRVEQAGGRIRSTAPVDLGDRAQAFKWIQDGIAEAGGIDILYNNAGAVRFAPFPDVPTEDWAFTLRNELDIVWHATQASWPHLVARGGGSIINVASLSGMEGNSSLGTAAHSAAKGGVIALSRQLAAEGAPHRIRVNSISPGAVLTPAFDQMPKALMDEIAAGIPLGRWGRPEDIAYCALYLASDQAAWTTGANFVVDGGHHAIR